MSGVNGDNERRKKKGRNRGQRARQPPTTSRALEAQLAPPRRCSSRCPSSANSPLLIVALAFASRFPLPPYSIPASSASNPLPAPLRPRIHFLQLVVRETTPRYSSASNSLPASRRPRTHFPLTIGREFASRFSASSTSLPAPRRSRIHFPLLVGLGFTARNSSSKNPLPPSRLPRCRLPLLIVRELTHRYSSARESSLRRHPTHGRPGEDRTGGEINTNMLRPKNARHWVAATAIRPQGAEVASLQPGAIMAQRLPTATRLPSRSSADTSRMRDCQFAHTQDTATCARCAAVAPVHISRHLSAWTEGVYSITYANRWLAASYSRHTKLVIRARILTAPRKW